MKLILSAVYINLFPGHHSLGIPVFNIKLMMPVGSDSVVTYPSLTSVILLILLIRGMLYAIAFVSFSSQESAVSNINIWFACGLIEEGSASQG